MKRFLKEYWKYLLIFFIIGVVLIPTLIHIAFKTTASFDCFIPKWTADGFIEFYGAALGSIATIFVFALTIKYNRDIERENRKNNVKPFLQSVYKPVYDLVENTSNDILIYAIVEKNQISSMFEIPFSYKNAYSHEADPAKTTLNILNFTREKHVLSYTLSNIGAGNSINTDFRINKQAVMPPFALPTDKTITMIIILESELLVDDEYIIDISITYEDVTSIGFYRQEETIRFFRDFKDSTLSTSQKIEWLLSKPQEVKEVTPNA